MPFRCNVCGAVNQHEVTASEPASCSCGANVRIRAMLHLLSLELFGTSLDLPDFPRLPSLRALGTSDHANYARVLEQKVGYTNTFADRPPVFDLSQPHPEDHGRYDFVLSGDVLEHVPPPVRFTLSEICRILKPNGFFVFTVFCRPDGSTREHFPSLHEFRVVTLSGQPVLLNRRTDGVLETYTDLVLHAGDCGSLEMRECSAPDLRRELCEAGFQDLVFLEHDVPERGIVFDSDTSQPVLARKGRFSLGYPEIQGLLEAAWDARYEGHKLARELATARKQLADVTRSRWVKLGRRLGLGPGVRLPE